MGTWGRRRSGWAWPRARSTLGCTPLERRLESLRYGTSPGRPSKLTPTQKARLKELVAAGPLAAGYPTGCWSSLLLADVIQRACGQVYNAHYICTLLHNLGLSFQRARFLSDHLDEERRRVWIEQQWPAILRHAQQRGALLLVGDEASFAPWGSLSYTWAPVGQQPLIKTCGKRKASKVFGLIDYVTERLFSHGQTDRFTAATYCLRLPRNGADPDRPAPPADPGRRALPHRCGYQGLHRGPCRSRERLPTARLFARLQPHRASVEEHEEAHHPQPLFPGV